MDSYYDSLNDFFELNEREHLASSAQLVYLHLLHLNDRSGNGGVVQVSDRQLETMTGLAKQSVTRAKQILKNRGLIDFKTQKGKPTDITLPLVGHPVGHLVGHLVGHPVGHSEANPLNLMRAQTRVPEAAPSPAPCPTPSPTPLTPPPPTPSPPAATTTTTGAGARESESDEATGSVSYTQNPETPELIAVLDYWEEKLHGGRLTFEHQSELEVYVNRYGLEWVKEAMRKAADGNDSPYGIRPKYLFTILKNKANPKAKATKGGEKDEQRDEYAKPPEYDFLDEWERKREKD